MIKEECVKEMQGLSLKNIRADFYVEGKKVYSDFGEMLFTHFGVSGPVILSASSILTEGLRQGKKTELVLDLKPALDEKPLDERILRDFSEYKNKDFRNALGDLLPKSMIPVIIERSGIDEFTESKTALQKKENEENLVNVIKNFRLTVTATRGFQEAVITKGGVNVKDINPATMESKLVSGLYFAGEVLDVDAFTGGL